MWLAWFDARRCTNAECALPLPDHPQHAHARPSTPHGATVLAPPCSLPPSTPPVSYPPRVPCPELLQVHPGYQLRLVGHSLGAGVAALMGLMLRCDHRWHRQAHAWARCVPCRCVAAGTLPFLSCARCAHPFLRNVRSWPGCVDKEMDCLPASSDCGGGNQARPHSVPLVTLPTSPSHPDSPESGYGSGCVFAGRSPRSSCL